MTCCGIRHERMGNCGDQVPQCIVYNGLHKMEEQYSGIAGCNREKEKICAHVTAKCANCGGNHTANSSRCVSRHKANLEARKRKKDISHRERKE